MTFSNIYGTASFWTKIFITLCIMLIMLIISAILIWLFSTGFSNILSQSDILVGSMSIQCIFLFISTAVVTAGLFSSRPFITLICRSSNRRTIRVLAEPCSTNCCAPRYIFLGRCFDSVYSWKEWLKEFSGENQSQNHCVHVIHI